MNNMLFVACEKHTQTEVLDEERCDENIINSPGNDLKKEKMSISSVETICSYDSNVEKGEEKIAVDQRDVNTKFGSEEYGIEKCKIEKCAIEKCLGECVSSTVEEVSTSGAFKPNCAENVCDPEYKSSEINNLNLCMSTRLNRACGESNISNKYDVNILKKEQNEIESTKKESFYQNSNKECLSLNGKVNSNHWEGDNKGCIPYEDGYHSDKENNSNNTLIKRINMVDDYTLMMEKKKKKNIVEGNNTVINEDSKKVIIRNIKDTYKSDTYKFNYLNGLLEQTYKEYVDVDGSEFIYIYDICVVNKNRNNGNNKTDEDNNKEDDMFLLNVYDIYVSLFNNFSSKISKVKNFFSPVEVRYINDSFPGCSANLPSEVADMLNSGNHNVNNILQKGNNKKSNQLRNHSGCFNKCLKNRGDTNTHDFHSLFSEDKQGINNSKPKFLDKLNYIFSSALKSDKEACTSISAVVTTTATATATASTADAATTGVTTTTTYLAAPPSSVYRIMNNDLLQPLNAAKIQQHMKRNVNRRVYETDIYDIMIIKKGYTYVYMQNGEWKCFYCVLFYLKSNAAYKSNLIFQHYCKIYDKEYFLNLTKSSDTYTNYFVAFFQNTHVENKKGNIELSILIRKNYYEFIIEISKDKKPNILSSSNYIYVDEVRNASNYLNIFDIHNFPYYLIPFEILSKDNHTGNSNILSDVNFNIYSNSSNNQLNETNTNSNVLTDRSITREILFNYDLLKEWSDCIYFIIEKMIHPNNNMNSITQRDHNEKTHYVSKKFNQWIEAFKQERNIRGNKRVC
ncbi:conserved Plasmodium protein, unknown function [Plasmodium malariae]|uniref:Uncharacterized protein n=1 Tax=Plasmodium malariae TaxID=5858 RepID=A0A1C3KZV3_PLAMA|nr:conserved Plasmodium protein, unknown function [Plasmodium malariae]